MKNIRSAALLPLFLFAALLFSGVPAAARADLPAKAALKSAGRPGPYRQSGQKSGDH